MRRTLFAVATASLLWTLAPAAAPAHAGPAPLASAAASGLQRVPFGFGDDTAPDAPALAAPAGDDATGDGGPAEVAAGATGSPLALPVVALAGSKSKKMTGSARTLPPITFSPERARVLLQSLAVPGWGQATLGRRTAASVFGMIEVGVWTSFVAFRVQEELRMRSAVRTARLFAGIDLEGRDESFRRLVGDYPSSDDYNLYVVARDAANQFYERPDRFQGWLDTYELTGADTWSWDSAEHFQRFRDEIKDSQRAGLRANTALALAIANRIASALHATRYAGNPPPATRTGMRLEPSFGRGGATLALRARF